MPSPEIKSLVFIQIPLFEGGCMIKIIIFGPNGMNLSKKLRVPMRGGVLECVPLGTEITSEKKVPTDGCLSRK